MPFHSIFLCFHLLNQNTQDGALPPSAPIVFSQPDSKAKIPVNDVETLKRSWRSKDIVNLPSGNFGVYKNGAYYVISKDTPILKDLSDKFLLAKRILELSSDGRAQSGRFQAKGSEFSSQNLATLAKLIERWTAFQLPSASLENADPLLFSVRQILTFKGQGRSISLSPKLTFPDQGSMNDYLNKRKLKAGTISEVNFESSAENRLRDILPLGGTEATAGGICTRVFCSYDTTADFMTMNTIMVELVSKLYNQTFTAYRKEINQLSQRLREIDQWSFQGFDQTGLSEKDESWTKSAILGELQKGGSTSQEAESQAASIKFSGRDINISLQTKLIPWGKKEPPRGLVATVNIWP